MFNDADSLGPEFYEFQKDFFIIGEFDDAIKVSDIKKILEVLRGINAHLLGHQKAFGLGFNVANPNEIDI